MAGVRGMEVQQSYGHVLLSCCAGRGDGDKGSGTRGEGG